MRSWFAVVLTIFDMTTKIGDSVASAASKNWDPALTNTAASGGTDTWNLNTTANWFNPGTAVDEIWTDSTGTQDTAIFGGTAGVVTLGTNVGALGLVFNTTGYTIATVTGPFTLSPGASGIDSSALTTGTNTMSAPIALVANQMWNLGGAAQTNTGVVSGTGFSITKTGDGLLTLNALNNFSGGLNINQGQVTLLNGAGAGSGVITMANGTTVRLANSGGSTTTFVGNAITIAPGATATISSNSASNGYSGSVTGDATTTLAIGGGTSVSFSAAASLNQFANLLGTFLVDTAQFARFSASSALNNGGINTTFDIRGTAQLARAMSAQFT